MEKERNMKKEKERKNKTAEYLIVERIDDLLSKSGMSRADLTAKVKKTKANFGHQSFATWSARKTIPSADIALAIADALQCSVRWLITGNKDKEEEYTHEEKGLVAAYKKLDKQGKHEVNTLLNAKINRIDKGAEPEAIALVEKKAASG